MLRHLVGMLDTTHGTNKFKMLVGFFTGVSDMGCNESYARFMCAEESNEDVEWVLQCIKNQLCSLVNNQQPAVMITDEGAAFIGRVAEVFPNSSQRRCIAPVHLPANVKKHVAAAVGVAAAGVFMNDWWIFTKKRDIRSIATAEEDFIKMLDNLCTMSADRDGNDGVNLADLQALAAAIRAGTGTTPDWQSIAPPSTQAPGRQRKKSEWEKLREYLHNLWIKREVSDPFGCCSINPSCRLSHTATHISSLARAATPHSAQRRHTTHSMPTSIWAANRLFVSASTPRLPVQREGR